MEPDAPSYDLVDPRPVAAEHPYTFFLPSAAEIATVGKGATGEDHGHSGTGVGVGGAGYDLGLLSAEVHLGDAKLVGVGVGAKLDDLPHHNLAVRHAELLYTIHFLTAQREEFDQFIGRKVEVYVLAEPA